jgi:hypothetical protein
MKKKELKKLTLSTETLRNLNLSELKQADGGFYSDLCNDPNTIRRFWYLTSAASCP